MRLPFHVLCGDLTASLDSVYLCVLLVIAVSVRLDHGLSVDKHWTSFQSEAAVSSLLLTFWCTSYTFMFDLGRIVSFPLSNSLSTFPPMFSFKSGGFCFSWFILSST